jgi:hypothetical protein
MSVFSCSLIKRQISSYRSSFKNKLTVFSPSLHTSLSLPLLFFLSFSLMCHDSVLVYSSWVLFVSFPLYGFQFFFFLFFVYYIFPSDECWLNEWHLRSNQNNKNRQKRYENNWPPSKQVCRSFFNVLLFLKECNFLNSLRNTIHCSCRSNRFYF